MGGDLSFSATPNALAALGDDSVHLRAVYLGAQCLMATNDNEECIALLEKALGGTSGAASAAAESMNRVRSKRSAHQVPSRSCAKPCTLTLGVPELGGV
jgi:hypothetical protein